MRSWRKPCLLPRLKWLQIFILCTEIRNPLLQQLKYQLERASVFVFPWVAGVRVAWVVYNVPNDDCEDCGWIPGIHPNPGRALLEARFPSTDWGPSFAHKPFNRLFIWQVIELSIWYYILTQPLFPVANLNTYVISYMRHRVSEDITYADWIYFSTTKTMSQGFLMPVAGIISRKIGLRPSLIIGSALYRQVHLRNLECLNVP